MASDLVPEGTSAVDDVEVGLTQRQITALERLYSLGAGPRESPNDKYDSDPQIRALQMVYEGVLGGPGRGQGRPTSRDQRISVTLTEYVRTTLAPKVKSALDRALRSDAGERINLDAIKLIVEMEHKEAKLQLSEDALDLDNLSKEDLLATLFDLVQDAQTGGIIEATFTEVTAGEATATPDERQAEAVAAFTARKKARAKRAKAERQAERQARTSAAASRQRNGDSSHAVANGTDNGGAGAHRARSASGDREARPNPVTQAALRRAANRR